MIASKFVKCIDKLFNLYPYHLLSNFKHANNPKFIAVKENQPVKETEKLNIEKLCENLDLENSFKLRNCNRPSCKSDVSMLKASNYKYPPACHSVPCCNSNLSNFSGKISEYQPNVSATSIRDVKSTRSQATCTPPLNDCKSAIYILDQRKENYPKKPFSAPCKVFTHDDAVRELCDKAMKTCAEARIIINFYKYHGPQEDYQIERNSNIELANKNKNLGSNIKLEITPCPYCTQPSSISQNYSCPFCAKKVKNCTCIHCPHCKKSRITAPCKKSNQSKFFKFDKPLSHPLTGKTNPPDTALDEKIKMFVERYNPCECKIESDCKISEQKTEKLFVSKSEDKKRSECSIDKNRKTRSLSPDELHIKPIKKKLKQSHGQSQEPPLLKRSDKILRKKDFAKNIPIEENILQIPWMPPKEATVNEAKICERLRSNLNPKMRNSNGDRILNEHLQKVYKFSERKVKMCAKQENVEKKQKGSSKSETLKQSRDGKFGKNKIKLQKRWNNSSDSSIKLIYPTKADRPLPLNKNANSVRNYCDKKETKKEDKKEDKKQDGSQPQDFLCECPDAVREIGRCEQMEYDEYFGDCYKCREYFQYDKYSYFTMEECMKKYRIPQPSSRKK